MDHLTQQEEFLVGHPSGSISLQAEDGLFEGLSEPNPRTPVSPLHSFRHTPLQEDEVPVVTWMQEVQDYVGEMLRQVDDDSIHDHDDDRTGSQLAQPAWEGSHSIHDHDDDRTGSQLAQPAWEGSQACTPEAQTPSSSSLREEWRSSAMTWRRGASGAGPVAEAREEEEELPADLRKSRMSR
jgi:hypothetical protein